MIGYRHDLVTRGRFKREHDEGGKKTSLRKGERMRRECGVMNILPWKLFVVILLPLFFAIGGVCW
jgi:hypothetical protein